MKVTLEASLCFSRISKAQDLTSLSLCCYTSLREGRALRAVEEKERKEEAEGTGEGRGEGGEGERSLREHNKASTHIHGINV